YLRLEDNAKTLLGSSDKSGIFMGFDVGYASDLFYVNGGYVKTDKDMPIYALATDNDGFIQFGQQLYTMYTNEADAKTFYLYGGLTYNKYGAEIGYGTAEIGANKNDYEEFYGLVSYQYAKNLYLELYYSVLTSDVSALENNELRFEINYTF
ncbi:MAG: hypothetical protein ACK5LP_00015, partial [Campylobacteraceae bacterium]